MADPATDFLADLERELEAIAVHLEWIDEDAASRVHGLVRKVGAEVVRRHLSPAAPSRSHAGDRPNDDASNHSPAAPLSASLPEGARAPNREALSGFSDHRFHEARNV